MTVIWKSVKIIWQEHNKYFGYLEEHDFSERSL